MSHHSLLAKLPASLILISKRFSAGGAIQSTLPMRIHLQVPTRPYEGDRLQDAAVRVKALSRWNNYYIKGIRQIMRDYYAMEFTWV